MLESSATAWSCDRPRRPTSVGEDAGGTIGHGCSAARPPWQAARLALLIILFTGPKLSAANRSVIWKPYRYEAGVVNLYHLDAHAAGDDAAATDDLSMDDLLADDELVPEGADQASPADRGLANANPAGRPAELIGAATFVRDGRFGGGLELPDGKSALLLGQGGHKNKTVEWWFRPTRLPAAEAALLFQPPSDSSPIEGEAGEKRRRTTFRLLLTPAGELVLDWAGTRYGPVGQLRAGRWSHIALNWNWMWTDHAESVRLFVNGTRVACWKKMDVQHMSYGSRLFLGCDPRGGTGVTGRIDEVRFTSRPQNYYRYNLDWADEAGQVTRRLAPPYVRDADDLLFHLPFEESLEPARAPGAVTVVEEHLKLTGLAESRAARGYGPGVHRDSLRLGKGKARPIYRSTEIIDPAAGTLAFWLRPLNWDTYKFVDHRRDKGNVRGLRLFEIHGKKPVAPNGNRNPMRGGDPSLMAVSVAVTPDSNRGCDAHFAPGAWTHVAITWQAGKKAVYIDGERRRRPAIGAATHAWYARTKTMDIFRDSTPRELRIVGASGDLQTLLDDVRIFRRALTAPEIQNLVRLYNATTDLQALSPLHTTVRANGVLGRAKVWALPLGAAYEKVQAIRATVVPAGGGKPLGTETAPVGAVGEAAFAVETGPYPFGDYVVRFAALDEAGAVCAKAEHPFTRERPPWWESKAGLSDRVMPGWTPMQTEGQTVFCALRAIELGPSGLPRQVLSRGEPILSAAPRLAAVRDGEELAFQPTEALSFTKETETAVEFTAAAAAPGLGLTTKGRIEYDGMMWLELTFAPAEGGQAVLDTLTLTLPYREEAATLCHWWTGSRPFRDPRISWIDALPKGTGVLLASNNRDRWVLDQGRHGSFIPYVMLTGMERGMAWFAENDTGWTVTDAAPTVAVERQGKTVQLVLRILQETTPLAEPRTFAFGLHPLPVRPLSEHWRGVAAGGYAGPMTIDTFSDNELKGGEGATFNIYPEGGDWDAVRQRVVAAERMKGRVASGNQGFERRWGRPPTPEEAVVPALYQDLHYTGMSPAFNREFDEAWGGGYWSHRAEFVDYTAWAFAQWVEKTDRFVQGAYVDDCWGLPLSGPTAYTLSGGQVQKGWPWRQYRARIRRYRQILVDQNLDPRLTAHSTNTLYIPFHSWFQTVVDGEMNYSNPKNQKDFIDKWSLGRLLFMNPRKWGLVTTWLGHKGNDTLTQHEMAWAHRQSRAYHAFIGLADISGAAFGAKVRGRFAFVEPGTRFLGPGQPPAPGRANGETLHLAAWLRPGKALLLVSNLGDKRVEAAVRLDLEALGLGEGDPDALTVHHHDPDLLQYFNYDITTVKAATLGDANPFDESTQKKESEEDLLQEMAALPDRLSPEARRAQDPDGKWHYEGGVLTCPVRRHDYRLFLFSLE